GGGGPSSASRSGNFKRTTVCETGGTRPDELVKDPGDRDNVVQHVPDKRGHLVEAWHDLQRDTGGPGATLHDPAYAHHEAAPGGRDQRGKGQGKGKKEKENV